MIEAEEQVEKKDGNWKLKMEHGVYSMDQNDCNRSLDEATN